MAGESQPIVVVEDDPNIAELIELYLRRDGHRVIHVRDALAGLEVVARERTRLVILDIGLPGPVDGFEACRRLRSTSSVPVMMVTARADEIDRVLGFELGADDYITKPFSPRELAARVKAIIRRSDGPPPTKPPVLVVGDVEVDAGRREVRVAGRVVPLATREFDLLQYLASNRGLVLSRQQLLDAVWGMDWYGDARTVDVHVGQLRKKLSDGGLRLVTVWGIGYRLD
jgi:DNA-binding response OmpR family regulator